MAGGAFFPRNYSRQDQGVAEAVLTFFTNFAKTGNPNEPHKIESVDYGTPKEKTRYRGLTWEQYETGTQQYLTIGEFLPAFFSSYPIFFIYLNTCVVYILYVVCNQRITSVINRFSDETENEEPLPWP